MKKSTFEFILVAVVGSFFLVGCKTNEPKKPELIYPVGPVAQKPTEEKASEELTLPQNEKKEVSAEEANKDTSKTLAKASNSSAEEAEVKEPEVTVKNMEETPLAKKEEVETELEATAVEEEAETVAEPKEKVKKWYLRIIALPYHDYYKGEADKIRDYLTDQDVAGAETHTGENKKGKKFWVVDIATDYESGSSSEAKEFMAQIREIKYQRRTQFQDAYYVFR